MRSTLANNNVFMALAEAIASGSTMARCCEVYKTISIAIPGTNSFLENNGTFVESGT